MRATDLQAVSGLLAGICGAVDTVPYVRGIWRRTTIPHRGTWLVWSALGLVALQSQEADGARWSVLPLAVQAAGTCLVFVLSVRYGSGGLHAAELTLIALALAGIVAWRLADTPFLATACVIAADLLAALMMLPKAWRAPHSETLCTFALASVGGALTVGAVGVVGTRSIPLLAYPVYFSLVNGALAAVIAWRRTTCSGERVGPAAGQLGQQLLGVGQ